MLAMMALICAAALADVPEIEPPIVEQHETYYDISGATEKGLALAIEKLSPYKPHPAYTEWRVLWVYQTKLAADGTCRVATAQSKVQTTMTLPRWTDASLASDALRLSWNLRMKEVRQHEQEHVRHGIAAGEAVQKALLTLEPAADCQILETNIAQAAHAVVEDAQRKDRSFDLRTAHGITGWMKPK